MTIQSLCVFCASSRRVHPEFLAAARRLGELCAEAGVRVVYGGGKVGLMGELAAGALSAGGEVVGVIPRFMVEVEWGHEEVSELVVTADMHERIQVMGQRADAFAALPGGCGTFEELFQAMTAKRLELHRKPICVVDVRGYFEPLLSMLDRTVEEGFMDQRHRGLWCVAKSAEDTLDAIERAPAWQTGSLGWAVP